MRWKLIGLFFMITLCVMSYSASISITSPISGDIWCVNNTYTIEWTTSGQMDENVRIRLLNHPALDVAIAITNSTPTDDNSFSWTIPSTVAPGNYCIRVRTTDAAVFKDSEVFEISDCSSLKPDLVVRDLSSGLPGNTYNIKTQPRFRGKIVNIGTGIAQQSNTRLIVTGPGGFVGKATYSANKTRPIGPNESQYVGFGTIVLPRPGNYTYRIIADFDKLIEESNEGNNSSSKTYYLPPCNLPDLTVQFKIKVETILGITKKNGCMQ